MITRYTIDMDDVLECPEGELVLFDDFQLETAQLQARVAELEGALAAERERICAAIKAEDDYCVTEGGYMLDSDDCVKIVRGVWVRPDYSVGLRP